MTKPDNASNPINRSYSCGKAAGTAFQSPQFPEVMLLAGVRPSELSTLEWSFLPQRRKATRHYRHAAALVRYLRLRGAFKKPEASELAFGRRFPDRAIYRPPTAPKLSVPRKRPNCSPRGR